MMLMLACKELDYDNGLCLVTWNKQVETPVFDQLVLGDSTWAEDKCDKYR